MIDHSELWKQWKQELSRWQLGNLTAILLESSGAFHPVIAQFLLMSQPMFGQTARKHMDAIVDLLEEPEMCQTFTDYLAKEPLK